MTKTLSQNPVSKNLLQRCVLWPKITVVTPNFNQAAYIEQTILSVLEQNYPNLEFIVIDGGSTDGSLEIIKKYAEHFAYWVSEPDSGVYEAINKGFKHSTGEIMMWLNSDDLFHPHALFNVGEIFFKFSQVSWITGIATSYDEIGRVIGAEKARGFSYLDFCTYKYQWLQQESTAWRRGLWEATGGTLSNTVKFAADFELWLRFFQHTKLYTCEILIGGFRMRSKDQLSADNIEAYLSEVNQIIQEERSKLRKTDIYKIWLLESITVIKKILRISYIFDLKIYDRALNYSSRIIRGKSYRLQIDRNTGDFKIVIGQNA